MIQCQTSRRRFFLRWAFGCLLAGLLLPAHHAQAHAIVVSSKPAFNSKVTQGPIDILLQFNSRIDLELSRVSLVDPAGKISALAAAGGATPGSLVAQGNADVIGPWKLRWQVLSADGHITRGEIPFLVIEKTAP